MIDIAGFEKDFTAWVANLLGMTVDTDIFRGAIPAGVAQGVCVRVDGEIPDYRIHFPRLNVQILAKDASRDALWGVVKAVREAVPAYGVDISANYCAKTIVNGGDAMPYTAADGGVVRNFVSLHLFVQVVEKKQATQQQE